MVDIFDILGPIMVGPSSSHTAGAARIGAMARTLLGSRPVKAEIGLHGSFAETGPGHGTDRAAAEEGLRFHFHEVRLREAHPNTAVLELTGEDGKTLRMQASSVGGGRIRVDKLDEVDVGFTGDYNTLIIHSLDISGELANVTREISRAKINIANMSLYRSRRGGAVLMVIETDQVVPPVVRELINELPGVAQVTCYEKGED